MWIICLNPVCITIYDDGNEEISQRKKMSVTEWILINLLTALFWLWVHKWSGAYWLERWQAAFMACPWWTADQLRTYAYLVLFAQAIWFVVGLANPEYRFGLWLY